MHEVPIHRVASLCLVLLSAQACDDGGTPGDAAPTTAGSGGATAGQPSASGSGGGGGVVPVGGKAAGSGGAGSGAQATAGAAAGMAGAAVGGTGGVASTAGAGGAGAGASGAGGGGSGAGGSGAGGGGGAGSQDVAAGLHELFIHDACTGDYAPQPDTCLHMQRVEREITLGGEASTVYDVTVRVRGLFEPTTISGGQAPLSGQPYFKIGGTVAAADYSQWHIDVSNPKRTYWLNHYPSTAHRIYQEDFEATLTIAGGAKVVVGAVDGNDREIDNAEEGLADRRKRIDGVTDEVLDGQMLRLDVIKVEAQP